MSICMPKLDEEESFKGQDRSKEKSIAINSENYRLESDEEHHSNLQSYIAEMKMEIL